MLHIVVSNSHFEKRLAPQEMTTFRFHVGAQSANCYSWNFLNLAMCPSSRLNLVVYYCHVHETSNYGYTTSGGWTFCVFVDFRVFIYLSCYTPLWRSDFSSLRGIPILCTIRIGSTEPVILHRPSRESTSD